MAYIENIIANKLIKGTNYSDSIVNGNYWNNGGTASTILSGAGNDTIENWGFNVSINGGEGRDYIYNKDIFITGGSIEYASNVSIEGGKGNDTLHNMGAGIVYIYNNGDGNDLIRAFDEDDTLLVARGTWSTKKSGSDVIVTVGDGKITLEGAKNLSKVNIVSSMADVHPVTFINNIKTNTLVTGTSYKDSIYNDKVSSVTINADTDNDTIENRGGSNVSIDGGAGNDVIENWLPTWASGRVDTSFLSCKNVTLNGGADNDYISNNVKNVTIIGGTGNDYIFNYNGNTGDITGLGASVSINAGAGNDYIDNNSRYVTIMSGSGNDTIENYGDNVTIAGNKGNDLISLYSSIYGYNGVKNNVILYNAGDGNDLILNFNVDSTLSISGGTYSTTESGCDVIVTVGDGQITLQNVLITSNVLHINDKDIALKKNIKLTDGNDSIEITENSLTVDSGAGNDSITNDGNKVSIYGGKGNDSIVNGEYFNKAVGKYSTINGGSGRDTIENYGDNVSIYGGSGNDYINSSNKYEEITKNVTINAGTGNDTVVIAENSKKNLIEYKLGDGNDLIEIFNSTSTLSISDDTYSTSKSGNDIIVTVGDGKITLKNIYTNVDKFHINDQNISLKKNINLTASNDSVTNYRNSVTINAGKGNDTIENFGNTVSINSGAGNDSIWNNGDSVTIEGGNGSDTIYNTNYYNGLHGGGDSVKIDGGAGDDSINNYYGDGVTIDGGSGNDTIDNEGDKVIINSGNGADYIFNGGNSVSINGGEGDDSIMVGLINDDVSIDGGAGNDFISVSSSWYTRDTTIKCGTGNDTIYGNSEIIDYHGSTYEYNEGDGNDIIYGFISHDKLQIGGGSGTYSSTKSGDDIIVTVGEGKITLVGAASLNTINIKGTKLLTLTNKTSSPVTVDATTGIIDASSRTKAIKITGNDLANTIIGGSKNDSLYGRAGNDSIVGNAGNDKLYGSNGDDTLVGGKGNDTLWGDAGNDKLYGGDGKDVFIYKPGEGTDHIVDYSSGDMLKILKSDGQYGGSFTNSSFKNGNLTLSISGGGKVIFDDVASGDKFNINGKTYTLSGTKLK